MIPILIIEDDKAIRSAMEYLFRTEGYLVQAVSNGAEGLSALESGELPHLIILDLMMPVMDGTEFIKRQRQNPAWAKIPIIVLSGDTAAESKLPPGIAGLVTKPVDIEDLLGRVKNVVQKL